MNWLLARLTMGVSRMTMQGKTDTIMSGDIKVKDGGVIHYLRTGKGTPLILLHGNSQSSAYFEPQMDLPFDTIAIDSRTQGKSSSSKSLNFKLMAQDLLDVLDALHLKKVDILGFSDGANIAMMFAKNYPERVNKLILNSGNLKFLDIHFIFRVLSKIEHFFVRSPVSALLVKDIGVKLADLKKFMMPVLVIVGQYDLIRLSSSKKIAQASHGQFIEIPRGFHTVSQSKPTIFNRYVTRFLQDK